MPLPTLKSKPDHMLKSIVRILFNSKCGVERQIEINRKGVEGEKENERESLRPVASHWSSCPVFPVVGAPQNTEFYR